MSKLEIYQFPYLSDNYGVFLHDAQTGETAAIDCGDAGAYEKAMMDTCWKLTEIWVTHHHPDHTDGIMTVKQLTGARVRGPKENSKPISGLDEHYWDGDSFTFAGHKVDVISTPGHTTDMINFYIADESVVFTGDTLFTLGCGRLFEGSAALMWEGMQKLMKLPFDTTVYGSHEYTLANARFAVSVDPDNQELLAKKVAYEALRAEGKPTVPTVLETEFATNPFLRPHDPSIRKHLGMESASDSEVFAEIRKRKDNF